MVFILSNGSTMVDSESTGRFYVNDRYQALFIRDIQESDAGVYWCGFQEEDSVSVGINVEVTDNAEAQILLPSALSVGYDGDPLVMECGNDTSWILPDEQVVNGTLVLPSREVTTGLYRCVARDSNGSAEMLQFSVLVFLDFPPIPREAGQAHDLRTLEGQLQVIRQDFRFPLSPFGIIIQWKEIQDGRSVDVDFSWRLTVSRNILRLERHAAVSDNGSYEVNISNQHGYAVFPVNIDVIPLEETEITLFLPNSSCDILEAVSCKIS